MASLAPKNPGPRRAAGFLAALLFTLFRPAAADWAGDEAFLKRLRARLVELRAALELLEQHRRSLDMVEAELSTIQLGLADPERKPDELAVQLIERSHPGLRLAMTRLPTRQQMGRRTWRWRCRLSGPLASLPPALDLLQREGLFILPSTTEPVSLTMGTTADHGEIVFVGHHVRLRDRSVRAPPESRGSDAFKNRTDPLAREIRKLLAEVTSLRSRMVYIQNLDVRVMEIKRYLSHLKLLSRLASAPLQDLVPLVDLELVQVKAIRHLGNRVQLWGEVPSPSARQAALLWLTQRSGPALRYEVKSLEVMYGPPPALPLLPPSGSRSASDRVCLVLARARPVDLAAASLTRAQAVLVHGVDPASLDGVVARATLWTALKDAALAMGLALLRDGPRVLLLPASETGPADEALRASRRLPRSPALELFWSEATVSSVLSYLASKDPGRVEGAQGIIKSTTLAFLAGKTPWIQWLRLLGAGQGLWLHTGDEGYRLEPKVSGKTSLFAVPDPTPAAIQAAERGPPRLTDLPLANLRMRLVVTRGGEFAVVSGGEGPPLLVRRGAIVGRARSRVVRVDEQGMALAWSDGGIRARVVIPLATERMSRPAAAK